MTEHSMAIKVDVFPGEFSPLLKVINCAILMPDRFALTEKELNTLVEFKDSFADLTYEHGV